MDEGKAIRIAIAKAKQWAEKNSVATEEFARARTAQ